MQGIAAGQPFPVSANARMSQVLAPVACSPSDHYLEGVIVWLAVALWLVIVALVARADARGGRARAEPRASSPTPLPGRQRRALRTRGRERLVVVAEAVLLAGVVAAAVLLSDAGAVAAVGAGRPARRARRRQRLHRAGGAALPDRRLVPGPRARDGAARPAPAVALGIACRVRRRAAQPHPRAGSAAQHRHLRDLPAARRARAGVAPTAAPFADGGGFARRRVRACSSRPTSSTSR